jgi:hypothetical protein
VQVVVVIEDDAPPRTGCPQRRAGVGHPVGEVHDRWVVEVGLLDEGHREPLEPAVGADEALHEVGGRCPEDPRRRVVLLEVTALGEHRDPVAEPDGLVEIVRHEEHCLADLALQPDELGLQPVTDDRVDRPEGLVHQQHRRVGGEGTCDADALPLAAGELVRVPLCEAAVLEADQVEQLVGPGVDLLAVPPEQLGHGRDIGRDRLVREEPGLLDDVAHPPAQLDRVALRDVLALKEDAPAGRLDEAVDHLQRRRLAAPRRPDQDDELTLGHVEVQLVDGDGAVLVLLADAVESDHRFRGSVHPCPSCQARWLSSTRIP